MGFLLDLSAANPVLTCSLNGGATQGTPFTSVTFNAGPYYITFSGGNDTGAPSAKINTGPGGWAHSVPSGYTAWQ
jgi:hypothetical protein